MISNIETYDFKENRNTVMQYFLNNKNTMMESASLTSKFFTNPSVFSEEETNNILPLLKEKPTREHKVTPKKEYKEVVIRDGGIIFI